MHAAPLQDSSLFTKVSTIVPASFPANTSTVDVIVLNGMEDAVGTNADRIRQVGREAGVGRGRRARKGSRLAETAGAEGVLGKAKPLLQHALEPASLSSTCQHSVAALPLQFISAGGGVVMGSRAWWWSGALVGLQAGFTRCSGACC